MCPSNKIQNDLSREPTPEDGTKYRITASIQVNGVVERNDVVGAVYGQTEGLLGSELDLRTLQRASKVSRLDVSIESDAGRTVGTLTIGSRLEKPETAILAASLETIDQIGPCTGSIEVSSIEDVRTAKRREVADRAKELLSQGFQDGLDATDIIEQVKESARRESITTYQGLPAGPRVATSDSIIVVEGRADVRHLLECGIKNAIAVEGTDIPDVVATLSRERTTTAFVDGDRGGELVLRELRQIAAVDFVAVAPTDKSVEDLDRSAVFDALSEKVPTESLPELQSTSRSADPDENYPLASDSEDYNDKEPVAVENLSAADGVVQHNTDTIPPDPGSESISSQNSAEGSVREVDDAKTTSQDIIEDSETDTSPNTETEGPKTALTDEGESDTPGDKTLQEHVKSAMEERAVRLLDEDEKLLETVSDEGITEAIREADSPPTTVILPGVLTQSLLDVLAKRGVSRVIAEKTGEFAKQPTSVRVTMVDEISFEEAKSPE